MEQNNTFEHLGIIQITDLEEIFSISDPITEPAFRERDNELARSAFRAVAAILQDTGHITPLVAESFIEESERKIATMEQSEQL